MKSLRSLRKLRTDTEKAKRIVYMENIFDTHAHYSDSAFDEDRDELLAQLPSKGVRFVTLASSSVEDSIANSEISSRYDYIYAAAGVHPECVNETPSDYISRVRDIIKANPKMRAVGEIGLDYHYDGYDRELQISIFRRQLELAAELDLPVIVHSRDACEDTLNILKEYKPKGVVHCFSGSAETAKEILRLGMHISLTGVLTFKNARKAIEVLEVIPLDRFMLETDCPYMAPVPFRGKRCDSSMIAYTAEKAAEVKGISTQEMLDITCRNAMKFYGINQYSEV